MSKMTAKQAAAYAGCSITTLRNYNCGWCDQTLLNTLRYGCGAMYDTKCEPKDKPFYPWHHKTKPLAPEAP